MKIIKHTTSVFLFVLCSFVSNGQNKTIDSLKKVLLTQKEDTVKINTLNQLSLYLLDAGEYEEVYSIARQIMSMATKLDYTDGKGIAMNRIGNYFGLTDKYEDARKLYDSALYYFRKSRNKDNQADVYGSIASTYLGEQNPAAALEYTYKSLKLYEETGNKLGLAVTYLSLGSNYIREKDFAAATRNLSAASELFTIMNHKVPFAVANSMLASVFLEQNKLEEALLLDSIALKIYDEEGEVYNKGGLFGNRGNIYEKQGDIFTSEKNKVPAKNKYLMALQEYMSAAKIYEQTDTKVFFYLSFLDIGNIFIKLNNPQSAKNYLDETIRYLSSLDDITKKNYNEWFQKYYLVRSKLDSATEDLTKAYEHYKMYTGYKDNSSAQERTKRIQQLTSQYEFDKEESLAKSEQAKKDVEAKRVRNLQYSAIAIVLLLAVLFYWISRQKQKAKTKIEKAYSELKATQAQLIQSEKMASLGELTAGIAHEIQNPLNFVNNFSDVNKELLEELKEEAGKGNIDEIKAIANDVIANEEKINHHGKRADAIVKGMLQHSRTSSGQREPTDINKLVDEYLRLSYHGLRAKDKNFNADFKTEFDGSIGKINIVSQDMGRVLLNLINNAFCAVNEKKKTVDENHKPSVSVKTKRLNDKIEITVTDNGNGIPQNIVDKIFQPFFTTKPAGQGTGLGLSLSYDIIKAHDGEIKVNTKEDEGSEFIIELKLP